MTDRRIRPDESNPFNFNFSAELEPGTPAERVLNTKADTVIGARVH